MTSGGELVIRNGVAVIVSGCGDGVVASKIQ